MRRLIYTLAAVLVLAAPARAADDPPIRPFPKETVERLGRAIYELDRAAWVASDALVAKVPDVKSAHLLGWVIVDSGAGYRVRFLRDAGSGLEAGYDIDVTPQFKTRLAEPANRTLTEVEKNMWAARSTALDGLSGQPTCRPGYNTVVLRDPEREGWIVWLLAPMPAANVYPIGGHYRFSVSADGRRILQRDALSTSCMTMDSTAAGPSGDRPAVFGAMHLVSPTPVETHVFVQLQSGKPIMVAAGGRMWGVDKGKVRDMGVLPPAK